MEHKTVYRILNDLLEDLSRSQLEKFCSSILDRRTEPRVRRTALENKSCVEIADVLIATFTESGVKEVVLQTLKEIGRNDLRENFAKEINEGSVASVSKYGDIMKIETTGASYETAQQDKLCFSGVRASEAMAESDLPEMNNFKSAIKTAAQMKGFDPALIAAMISRSCRAGKTLIDGKGCYNEERKEYTTFGLMQIDVNANPSKKSGKWNDEEHICNGIDILMYFISRIKTKFPKWTKEQMLKGGLAAYNAGDENIDSYEKLDSKTTGGDYSNDVIARAQWYKREGDF